jgi:hypothetical protein
MDGVLCQQHIFLFLGRNPSEQGNLSDFSIFRPLISEMHLVLGCHEVVIEMNLLRAIVSGLNNRQMVVPALRNQT